VPGQTSTREWLAEALIVGTFSSRCGACGRGAFPSDETHDRLAGYGCAGEATDCGVRWRFVTTDYAGPHMEEATRNLRPDLEWRPLFPDTRAA
jgi:hypothetical protein